LEKLLDQDSGENYINKIMVNIWQEIFANKDFLVQSSKRAFYFRTSFTESGVNLILPARSQFLLSRRSVKGKYNVVKQEMIPVNSNTIKMYVCVWRRE